MKKYLALFLSLAALAGCNKQDPQQKESSIRIEPVITRATETDFQNGDKIGLSIQHGAEAYATNKCYVYEGSVFTGDLDWYTTGQQESVFTAYYPYAEQIPSTFSVAADQTAGGYGSSDLMGARKEGVTPQTKVAMVFKHMLTRILVKIDNPGNVEVEKVELKGSVLSGAVDFDAMTVTALPESEAKDILMAETAENALFAAIVIPQTVTFSAALTLKGKGTITKSLTETTLKAGGQYIIYATILPTEVKLAISGDIENWSDEGEIPEKPGKEITFHEYDTYFEYDGENYNIVEMKDGRKWMAENLRFLPDGYTPSASVEDVNNGVWYPLVPDENKWSSTEVALRFSTDAAVIKTNGYLYSFDVAFGLPVGTLKADNCGKYEGVKGICPPGWHIPTADECIGLVGKCNDGTKTKADAPYFDPDLGTGGSGSIAKLNEDKFNMKGFGTYYLSATATNKATLSGAVKSYLDGLNTGYFAGSTLYKASTNEDGSLKNIQYFGFMPFMGAGWVSVAFVAYRSGVSVRCIKDNQ